MFCKSGNEFTGIVPAGFNNKKILYESPIGVGQSKVET